MKKASAFIAAGFVLWGLTLAPSAVAATEFGSNCAADGGEPDLVVLDISHSSSEPLPAAAPTSGVITRWKTNLGLPLPEEGSASANVQVYRPAGDDQFTLVGQSSSSSIVSGQNSFATRIPVQAGDHIAFSGRLFGSPSGLFCSTADPADVLGYTETPPASGGTATFEKANGYRAPIAAVIEPDADNDGYGDETQDACPQLAAFQTACPLVVLDAIPLAGRKAVVVYVASSSPGPVSVAGTVDLGKGKKVRLATGPTTVAVGQIAAFKLKFTAKLTKRLQQLEPSKKLTLKITASAANAAGQVTADSAKVKLKGQG